MNTKTFTIDGVKYELDIDLALKTGHLKETIKRRKGQIYTLGPEPYILSSVDFNQMVLIELSSGNRQTDATPVKDPTDVTSEEWIKLGGSSYAAFKLVGESFSDVFSKKN